MARIKLAGYATEVPAEKVDRAARAIWVARGLERRCSPECVDHWEHEDYRVRGDLIRDARAALEA